MRLTEVKFRLDVLSLTEDSRVEERIRNSSGGVSLRHRGHLAADCSWVSCCQPRHVSRASGAAVNTNERSTQ